jgi:20S proteasome alpha/beta subunit
MTCIVAQKTTTGIVMGAESGATEGVLSHRKADPKVWNVNEQIAIGFSGSIRHSNVFRRVNLAERLNGIEIEHMADLLGEIFRPIVDPHTTEKRYGYCLIAVGREIFRLDSETGVIRIECDYSALGGGEEVAIGAMYASTRLDADIGAELPDDEEARQRISIALDATCEHVCAHRGPYHFVMTTMQ